MHKAEMHKQYIWPAVLTSTCCALLMCPAAYSLAVQARGACELHVRPALTYDVIVSRWVVAEWLQLIANCSALVPLD